MEDYDECYECGEEIHLDEKCEVREIGQHSYPFHVRCLEEVQERDFQRECMKSRRIWHETKPTN